MGICFNLYSSKCSAIFTLVKILYSYRIKCSEIVIINGASTVGSALMLSSSSPPASTAESAEMLSSSSPVSDSTSTAECAVRKSDILLKHSSHGSFLFCHSSETLQMFSFYHLLVLLHTNIVAISFVGLKSFFRRGTTP